MTMVIRKVLPVVGLLLILASLVRSQRPPAPGADTYFHLRMGSEFLGGWSIAQPGHLGRFDSADWIPTQWLAQMGMSGISDVAGVTGVMWVAGTLMILLVLAVYLSCRVWAAPLPAALATAMAYVGAAPGLSARPQLLSYLFVVLVTSAWLATARDGRPRYWLVLLTWVWVPLHGMWIVGILIGVVAVFGLALERRFDGGQLLRLSLIPLLSGVVALASPVGLDAYRSLVVVGHRSEYFSEWASPDLMTSSGIAMLAMIALVILSGLRREPLAWHTVCLLALAAAWGFYSERTVPVAALMAAPLVARALQSLLPDAASLGTGEIVALTVLAAFAATSLGVVLAVRSDEDVVPPWLDRQLDALPEDTRVLNDWDTGAYFLWRHPDMDFVMHGYGDVFTDSEIRRNADISRLQPEWDAEVRQLDVDVAVLPHDSPLGYSLREVLCWESVEQDDEFMLLTPPIADGPECP
jgi:hypothetical protein